jgi:hypothetical protein
MNSLIWTTLFSLFIFSCGKDVSQEVFNSSATSTSSATTPCSCSKDISPVCADVNGKLVSFKNGCLAQCSGYSYTVGECSSQDCNPESGAVCGSISSDLSPRVYSDECALLKAGADQVSDSKCDL